MSLFPWLDKTVTEADCIVLKSYDKTICGLSSGNYHLIDPKEADDG